MAKAGNGDLVLHNTLAGTQLAVVIDVGAGIIRTINNDPADDLTYGPAAGYAPDRTPVSFNDSGDPTTASLEGSARLVQDIRDGSMLMSMAGFQSSAWGRPTPTRSFITTDQANSDAWIEFSMTTGFTDLSFEVQHNLDRTITVEIYENKNGTVQGPDGAYADTTTPTWGWTSDPLITAWQPHTISFGSSYPEALSPRVWTVRVRSGPNEPGLDFFNARNFKLFAKEIVI